MAPGAGRASVGLLLACSWVLATASRGLPASQQLAAATPGSAPYQGTATPGYPELLSPEALGKSACGDAPAADAVSGYFVFHYAAINLTAHPGACGKCLVASCTDSSRCVNPAKEVAVLIVGGSQGGAADDVQLNSFAFRCAGVCAVGQEVAPHASRRLTGGLHCGLQGAERPACGKRQCFSGSVGLCAV